MALFKNRATGRVVTAERVITSLQVETEIRGWVTVGGGMWVVRSAGPGPKPDVYEDKEFRQGFEALDEDARAHLNKPMPTVPGSQQPGETPAPPNYMAAQNLPPLKTAVQFAAEQAAAKAAATPAPKLAKPGAKPAPAPIAPPDEDLLDLSGGLPGDGTDDIAIP